MRIGIKYCGGCNPRYDRVAYVRALAARCPETIFEPVRPGRAYDQVLVVCGCPARCAGVEGLDPNRLRYVCQPEPELEL